MNGNNNRILFVTSSYIQGGTSANLRNNALIEGLCDNGNVVDVISREPDTDPGRCDFSMRIPPVRKFIYIINREREGFDVSSEGESFRNKIKTVLLPFLIKIYKSLSIWDTWYVKVKKIKRIVLSDDYDIMISSSDPKSSHYLAAMILEQNKEHIGRWIQYWGDPFALDINQLGGSLSRIKRIECNLISKADKVVYVSPFTLEKQKKLYDEYSNKMQFLPIPARKKYQNHTTEIEDKTRLKLGYFGAYMKRDRNILPLYNAISKTKHSLEIIGPSDIVLPSISNIYVHEQERIPVEEIEKKEQEVDILVCVCNRSGTQIPGKVYHYAMTNKYILIILDGENANAIKQYLAKYKRYMFCYNNEDSIISALEKLRDEACLKMPCLSFEPQTIAKEFIQ